MQSGSTNQATRNWRRRAGALVGGVLAGLLMLPMAGSAQAPAGGTPGIAQDGVATAVARNAGLEGRVLWLDGTANLGRLSTREGVAAILDRCVRANINTVVVDVKPLSGHVLYDSKIAPRLTEWRGTRNTEGYDLLRVALQEGRQRGLKIHANLNVFSEGHKLVSAGPVYGKPDEQSVIYDVERAFTTPRGERARVALGVNRPPGDGEIAVYDAAFRQPRTLERGEAFALVLSDRVEAVVAGALAPSAGVRIPRDGYLLVGKGDAARWMLGRMRVGDQLNWTSTDRLVSILDAPSETVAAFVNPANPISRDYAMSIVDELVTNYDFDGIVFDRMRYASLQSDFSDVSRQKFEEHLGQRLNRWPGDVYSFDPTPGRPLVLGPYYKQWLEWRARTIRTWLEEASRLVRRKRPTATIGTYVGSWYSSYYSVGVNWASEEFAPGYDWMTPTYPLTGYAGLLDWITTGCYHPIAGREQAKNAGLDDSYTVQAAAELSSRAIGDQAFFYAGIYAQDYKGSAEAFQEAIEAARRSSQGVMLFDLSQIEEYGWWPTVEKSFQDAKKAPHDVPELLAAVRSVRRTLSNSGKIAPALAKGSE